MTDEIPTTNLVEFGTLTGSKESLETKEESTVSVPQTAIARMFTQANYGKTHTMHDSGIADVNRDSAKPVTPQELTLEDEEAGKRYPPAAVDKNEPEGKEVVSSPKEKRICPFIPERNINCSDRLTMQKTKAVLYCLPLFLVLSCFMVLITLQHITTVAFLLIVAILLSSFFVGWIAAMVVLFLLQIVLTIRDWIFWCIVNKWNLEQKKAFIQAYSGVDLMEELDDQQRQLETLRMLYFQQIRANEEMQLLHTSTNKLQVPNDNDASDDDDDDNNSTPTEPQVSQQKDSLPPVMYEAIKSDSEITATMTRNSNAVLADSNTKTNTILEDTTKTMTLTDDAKAIHRIMDIMDMADNEDVSTSDYTETNKQHDQSETMVVHQNTPGTATGTNVLKLLNPVTPYTPSVGYVYDNAKYKNTADSLMAKSHDIPKETAAKQDNRPRESESTSVATMVKKDSLKIVKPVGSKLSLKINANAPERTPSISSRTMSTNESEDLETPQPASLLPKSDGIVIKDPILPQQLGAIEDGEPYKMVMEPDDMMFDEEEDLNTPNLEDQSQDQLADMMQNTQKVETPIDYMETPIDDMATPVFDMDDIDAQLDNLGIDLDASQFSIWGTSPEEKDAFVYVTNSCSANLCKHMYRCCPLYRMKFGFCMKMSCELCHSLCIILSLLFFFSVVVFVTNNPVYFDVDVINNNTPYITEAITRTDFETSGIDKDDDIVIGGNELSRDVLIGILNHEQTFQYIMDVNSYFTPQSVQDIRDIIITNNNETVDKRKTIRVMGRAKSSSYVLVNNSDILIDFSEYPVNDPLIDTTKANCISLDCAATVTVNASMTVRNLNKFLFENSYVLHGFDSTDDIAIGGALGSCSFGPLFGGKSLGYYLVSVSLVDGMGVLQQYDTNDINSDGVRYLDAIRCNLGLLGVIYQVELEIFALQMVHRVQYYASYEDIIQNTAENSIGKEMFIDPYEDNDDNDGILWIVWKTMNESTSNTTLSAPELDAYSFEAEVFNTFITPISCILPIAFDIAIDHFMEHGRYYSNDDVSSLTHSIHKMNYSVSRVSYLIPQEECLNAIISAKELANELYDSTMMLPIGVTFITRDANRSSLIGYDDRNYCALEIQLNACSASRSVFAQEFESIVVNEYNGTGHWGYLWYNNDLLYRNRDDALNAFESIRNELDPHGIFINALYANLFPYPVNESVFVESTLMNHVYPRNYNTNVYSCYFLIGWFAFVFILYLIGSYFRLLPFLDSRNLCSYCSFNGNNNDYNSSNSNFNLINGTTSTAATSDGGCCCNSKCCDDMNELDELIENEQKLLEKYGYEDNFDKVVEDLIDVEVLDPISNEYVTITVTFKTAFFILMDDENNREWKYRDAFAVSTHHELNERFEKLGNELAWSSIYPRQCLFFSSCTVSVAMMIIAVVQAASQ